MLNPLQGVALSLTVRAGSRAGSLPRKAPARRTGNPLSPGAGSPARRCPTELSVR